MTRIPRLSKIKTAFETPEYTAKGKIFACHKINIYLGLPKYKVYPSRLHTLWGILWLIGRYAPIQGFVNLVAATPRFLRKVRSGRIPLAEADLALVLDRQRT